MMSEFSNAAARSGRGSRLDALFLGLLPLAGGLLPLAGLLAGCGGGGSKGEPSLIVTAVTPTNGQETKSDMSDPELLGQLRIKFTTTPQATKMIDPANAFNGLTPYVQILNQGFVRVAGTPSVDKSGHAFTFTPAGGTLPPAQYTVTLSKFVTTPGGKMLNDGVEDFSASWTVGPDIYNPVVRNTSPAPNQKETPLFTPIVITFNESLDPSSVVYGQTVFVEDGGTNPPTALNGTLLLKRNGFDIVFVPDPCVGMPPSTTIVFRMFGVGNTSFVRDRVGNGLVGDPTNANQYSFQFNTKGVKPLPIPANVPAAWSPRQSLFGGFTTAAFAVTNNATFEFDVAQVDRTIVATRVVDPSLTVQVLQNNAAGTWWNAPLGLFQGRGTYGGDWEAKLGQPGEAVVDWRYDSATGHSYIYQVDEANESVAIINTGTGKVEGHFQGIGTPKGITISGRGATGGSPTVFVTNYGQGTVTGINVGKIVPGKPICTAVKELRDNISTRVFMETGKNPSGIACEWTGTAIGAVVNQGDSDLQIFDPRTLKPSSNGSGGVLSKHFPVGENPIDVCWEIPLNVGLFCYVANQGGIQNPKGTVSLWWNNTSLIGLFNTTSGTVVSTLSDGVNVPGRPECDQAGITSFGCWFANTAGNDVFRTDLQVVGGGLGVAVTLSPVVSREIGPNPTRMTWTGLPFFNGAETNTAFAALAGSGQVAVWQRESTIDPPILYNLPGVKSVFSAYGQ